MTGSVCNLSTCRQDGAVAADVSSGVCAGPCAGLLSDGAGRGADRGADRGRPFDPHHFRAIFPDRWSAYLRAHFRDPVHVAYFFGFDEKAARNWWNGVSGQRGDKVALVASRSPAGFAKFLSVEAA